MSAVQLETTILNILLFLIIAVAGFGILATFFMIVRDKTRDIGILKSLGASEGYVLGILVREALTLGVLGTIVGILSSFGTKFLIDSYIPASMQAAIVPDWWPKAAAITLVGALLGAIYPAMKAARQDALESLGYE